MALTDLLNQDTLISMEEDLLSAEEDGTSGLDSTSDSEEEEDSEKGDDQDPQEDNGNIEMRIEDDFDRLVNNIRMNENTSASLLSKDWDFGVQDQDSQDAQFRDDLRVASGVGKRRRKGPRAVGPSLSFEVRALIGDGNQAYVDGNLPETLRIMLEVIRIEPRAASAWSVLAQCHEDMKQDQQALQLRIMAAHLRHDADEWDRLARQSKDLGYHQQALYCWGKLSSLDPANVNAQWDRALLARDMGDLRTTRSAFLAILKRFPHDPGRPAAFEHYQTTYPSGFGRDPTNGDVPGGGFGLLEILVLADLHNTNGDHGRAVNVIRQGCRWLQGRGEQRYWDICDDDREYDLPSFQRTVESGPQAAMFPLDVNARHRLTVARIKMGENEEAKLHVGAVLSEDVLDYAPLFLETADAYFEREIYSAVKASTSSLYILLQTATCLRMLNELRDAVDVYEYIRLVEPTHNEAKMKLAEIYEILNEPRKALDLVYEVIDSRKYRKDKISDPAAGQAEQAQQPSSSATTKSGRPRMSVEALMELEAKLEQDTLKSYRRLAELYPKISKEEVNDFERDWLLQAEKMIESFRECRQLFTTQNAYRGSYPALARRKQRTKASEADEDRMADRLQIELEVSVASKATASSEVFRALHPPRLASYCFLLTRRGQFEVAEEILKHIILSVAYRATEYQTDDSPGSNDVRRRGPAPLRVFIASLASGYRATDSFIHSPLTKLIHREMRMSHATVKTPELVHWNKQGKRFSIPESKMEEAADDDDASEPDESVDDAHPLPDAARKPNPLITALYGQMCVSAKSFQSAIFYLLYAYELCPDDPVICLSLAVASIGRAMQRQSDNRHHLIAQAMAVLARYRQFRTEQPDSVGEIDFNFGRAFHQLGLYTHAVAHYERVLKIAETQDSKYTTVAQEAAYNLSLIYSMTGAIPLAKVLYQKWLSL
ncbi:TPR-like protein [Mycena olivaceomarginata]|nr:TPR-like protein [Mycena olivaceomarginata]